MFIKDSSGLVINTDDSHYQSILARRKQKRRLEELDNDICIINDELKQIKSLLQELLNGKKYG